MKSISRVFLLSTFIMLLNFTSCKKNDDEILPLEPVDISLTPEQIGIINNTNTFAFDIFKKVVESSGENENIIISPLSISTALSMTVNGANGETRSAILEALKLNNLSAGIINQSYKELIKALLTVDKRTAISIANSVWTENDFTAKQQFIDALRNFYDADVNSFDIANPNAPDEINKWIENNTNGLIKEMIDNLEPNTVLLLINAIYFKGQWNSRFDKEMTVDESFFKSEGESIQVPMMKQKGEFKKYLNEGFALAEFPYGQGNFVMDVFLPDETEGVNEIIQSMSMEGFNSIISNNMYSAEIYVSFPRFKYGYKKSLEDILTLMGMGISFTDNADFSNISDISLKISKILHQAFIETNEEGTEAAAATVVQMVTTSIGPHTISFNLDHPFFYIIRETTTNTIMFMGRVSDPLAD